MPDEWKFTAYMKVSVVYINSPKSLHSKQLATFEDDAGAYDQKDAAGFIKLNALRLLGRQ